MLHTDAHTHFGFHSMNFSYNAISFCVCSLPAFFSPHLPRSSSVCRLHCVVCSAHMLFFAYAKSSSGNAPTQYSMSALALFLECVAPLRTAQHSTQMSLPVNIIAICNHLKIEYNTGTHTVGQMAISFFYVFIFSGKSLVLKAALKAKKNHFTLKSYENHIFINCRFIVKAYGCIRTLYVCDCVSNGFNETNTQPVRANKL